LHASEERFSKAFHATPISIAIATLGGEFLDVNEGFREMFGFERGEVIGRTAIALGIWVRSEERLRMIERLQAERTVQNFDCHLRTKSGEIRDALISAEIIEL